MNVFTNAHPRSSVRLALSALIVTMFLLLPFIVTPAANAANAWGTVIVGKGVSYVNVRENPSTSTRVLRTIGSGQRVPLDCYVRGQAITGPYGTSTIWYRIDGGGFVTDSYLETGSNNPVTPACGVGGGAPAPSSSLSAKTDAFVSKYNNRYVDFDGRYGAQCVDLFNYFNRDVVGAGFVSAAYAFQLYGNAPTSKYDKLPASATPQKGDVAVWSSNLPGSGRAGHVAIVLSNAGGNINVLEQNRQGSPSIVHSESKNYLLGYLRPRG